MAYNILLTSLYEADKDAPICYYFAKEGNRKYLLRGWPPR